MLQFIYNNKVYPIKELTPIRKLILNPDLLKLPLVAWKALIILVTGICDLYLILPALKAKINQQDLDVNEFIFKDKTYWFDKNTRASLLALASCSEDTITFVLGDELVELEVSKARKFLSDLEVYASKCFVNTAKHFKAIKELKTLEDIINYDYTTGYPNKLKFDEYLDLA